MAQLDPRMLMAAAMNAKAGGGMASAPTGAPTDAMPAAAPAAQPTGASPQGVGTPAPATTSGVSNADLSTLMGTGADLSQDPDAITQMVQALQVPGLPPDQKAAIQSRLQLAALKSLAGGAGGAVGAPSS